MFSDSCFFWLLQQTICRNYRNRKDHRRRKGKRFLYSIIWTSDRKHYLFYQRWNSSFFLGVIVKMMFLVVVTNVMTTIMKSILASVAAEIQTAVGYVKSKTGSVLELSSPFSLLLFSSNSFLTLFLSVLLLIL